MNVLVVSNLYPPNAVGGYERLVAQVASGLARRGHQVSVLTSDYGKARPQQEELPVERSLRLLAGENIYQPFAGTALGREAINRQNLAALSRKLEAVKPDAVLVGNLYFFDASILEGLRPVAERTVYLLTDVWRIHFADDAGLQQYFRQSVFETPLRAKPLVPADPAVLPLERLESEAAHAEYSASMLPELARRRSVEAELGGGRAVFQAQGTCHLCGATVFVVRLPGPATVMLGPRARAQATCARCGLDASARGALHVLDLLASPEESAEVLVVASDAGARRTLAERFPRCTVIGSTEEDPGAGRAFAHAICLEDFADAEVASRGLRRLSERVAPGGLLLAAGLAAETAGSAGLLSPWSVLGENGSLLLFWSREYGYLGRDYALGCIRATAR